MSTAPPPVSPVPPVLPVSSVPPVLPVSSAPRRSEDRKPRAGVVVRDVNGRILVIKDANLGGKVGFPKGAVEDGETHEMCAFRELLEEVGVKVTKVFATSVTWSKDTWFFAETSQLTTTIQETEISWCKWMTIEKLTDIPMSEFNRTSKAVMKYVIKFATFHPLFKVQPNLSRSCKQIQNVLTESAKTKYVKSPSGTKVYHALHVRGRHMI